MTNSEFSYQFDILYNNIMSNQAPGLDDYEKSVFLTKAQDELVLAFYRQGFEVTEQLRKALGNIVSTFSARLVYGFYDGENFFTDSEMTILENPVPYTRQNLLFKVYVDQNSGCCYVYHEDAYEKIGDQVLYDGKTVTIPLPENLWFVTYEKAVLSSSTDKCVDGKTVDVIPVLQDHLLRIAENPFKGMDKRVLRLDTEDMTVELVSKERISKYIVRYVRNISPIILSPLEAGLTIKGIEGPSSSELSDSVHYQILERAVNLARGAWLWNNNQQ